MAINQLEWFDGFSAKTVEQIEDNLIKWANTSGKNCVMVFDKETMYAFSRKIRGHKSSNDTSGIILHIPGKGKNCYGIDSKRVTITWRIVNSQMCVLEHIIINQWDVIYIAPSTWKNSRICYGFDSETI